MFTRSSIARAVAAAIALTFAGAAGGQPMRAVAGTVATADALPELPVAPEIRSVNGVAHLQLAAVLDTRTKLPAFLFGGHTVAPTIRVRPGDTIVLDYTNLLPAQSAPPLDMTNLHTHGLMDSPKAPGDQVLMIMIAPGQTYRYVYNIPRNQPPGLYWYHPHPHGESNRQVASGMSGLIIIEGVESYAPVVRGLAERDIILRDFYLDWSTAPLSRIRRRAVMREAARERAANPALPLSTAIRSAAATATALPSTGPDCDPGDADKGVTINGLPAAKITMRPGSRQFFRVVNASANSFFDLKIPGSRLLVVANDGVPLAFHDRSVQAQWLDHVLVPPAGRVEAVVEAPAQTGTPLQTACVDYGPDGDVDPARNLATIELGPEPSTTHIAAVAAPAASEPFGNIANNHIVARRVVNFSENNPDSEFYINGKMFDPNAAPMFTVRAGTVEEWTVANYADELHAFHIHQIHFLVEDVNGVRQPASTWRDTVTVPYAKMVNGHVAPGVVHLLMDFRDPIIVGTFVFHCHILEHEDYGMMAKIQVVGPNAALASTPDSHGFHEGFLSSVLPSICKHQTKTFKLCGCDKAAHVVSYVTPNR